jgi:hypothetical protein
VKEHGTKWHNDDIHNLQSWQNIIGKTKLRRMRWAWHAARIRENTNSLIILARKSGDFLEYPSADEKDNIKVDLKDVHTRGL